MIDKELPAGLAAALEVRDFPALKEIFLRIDHHDVAAIIEEMPEEDRVIPFRLLPYDLAADVFEYISAETQESLIKNLGQDKASRILNEMSADDRTELLEELPSEVTRQILQMLSTEERRHAVTLLGYPEESIGRLMTPDYIALRENWTVQQSLDFIRSNGKDSETLNVVYVTGERGKLLAEARIRFLLLADPNAKIADITDDYFISLQAWDDQEKSVAVFEEYDRVALPVTDSRNNLLGIVTIDDVLDVAREEATEDIQKMGGTEALDDPYIESGFLHMVRKRIGWLVLLFIGQLLTLHAIVAFEDEIMTAVVLVLFLPLIISSGGNSGSQAATLIIRSLALEEVHLRDWFRVLGREILSGIALGAVIASLGFLRIFAGGAGEFGPDWPLLGLTIAISLIGVGLWGSLVGSMLPFVMQRLGADPAASSTPFVTTVVDVTGLLFYLTVASLMLKGTFL
jgi:magnesium transporter